MLHNKKNGFAHPFVLLIAIFSIAFVLGIVIYNNNDFGTKIIGSIIEDDMVLDGDVAGIATLSKQVVALDKNSCTIFVSPSGNDSGAGTSEGAALKSITKAVGAAVPGDVVCLKGGTYREIVTVSGKRGTQSQPIKIGGYTGGGVPIISGFSASGTPYQLPDPTCKEVDNCGPRSGGGRCMARNNCYFSQLFKVTDSSYLQFFGFDVTGSSGRGFGVNKSNYIYVKGVRSYGHWNTGFQISNEGGNKTTGIRNDLDMVASFDNIRAYAEKELVGGGAMHIHEITSGSVKNSLIFNNFGEGLDVGKHATDVDISGNMFWDNYHTSLYANASKDATFNGNFSFCTGNRVKWLEDSGRKPGQEAGYGTGITVRNESGTVDRYDVGHGTVVTNNTVVGCTSGIIIAGQGSTSLKNVRVANNTIVSPRDFPAGGKYNGKSGAGIAIQSPNLEDIVVANNVIQVNGTGVSFEGGSVSHPGVKLSNNVISSPPKIGVKPGMVVADPEVEKVIGDTEVFDPSKIRVVDFVVAASSPAVGAGASVEGTRGLLDKDIFGNSRGGSIDAGSYKIGGNKSWPDLYALILGGAGGTGTDPEPDPVVDTDGDGFNDAVDMCPRKAAGDNPDPARLGCPMEVTVDQDGDGVRDDLDICPDTPSGANPDPNRLGCPMVSGDPVGDSVTLNGTFKTPKVFPLEVAQYWKLRVGNLSKVESSIVSAKQTDLAKAEAVRLDFVREPVSGITALVQDDVDMNPNTKYEVTFTARASVEGKAIFVTRDMGYITSTLAPTATFKLQPGWYTYKAVITTKNYKADKAASVRLGIQMPAGSNIVVDNVFVRPLQ